MKDAIAADDEAHQQKLVYDITALQGPLADLLYLWEILLLKQPLDSPVLYLPDPQIEQCQAMMDGDINFAPAESNKFSAAADATPVAGLPDTETPDP